MTSLRRLLPALCALLTLAAGAAAQTVPDFAATPTTGPQALEVQFENLTTSDSSIVSYMWDFGDGSPTSFAEHPLHVYGAPGSYTVSLQAWPLEPLGQDPVVETKVGFIVVEEGSLSVDFSAGPTTGTLPLEVRFQAQVGGDAGSVEFLWDFGDGHTSTLAEPVHTYFGLGPHTVTLTATAGELQASATQVDLVQPLLPELQAAFTVSGSPTTAGAPVRFTDTSAGGPHIATWDFGDGSIAGSGPNPVHVYTAPGLYDVTLTVSASGASDSLTVQQAVRVREPQLNAAFTATPSEGAAPLVVEFADAGLGTPAVQWWWEFGDGASTVEFAPTVEHTYWMPGTYEVQLTVKVGAFSDVTTGTITVVDPQLQAGVALFPQAGLTPLAVQFSDTSSGVGDYVVTTEFGDGTQTTAPDPLHEYAIDGWYTVEQRLKTDPPSSLYEDFVVLPDAVHAVDPAAVQALPAFGEGVPVFGDGLFGFLTGDLDGDGLPDLVASRFGQAQVALQQGGVFANPVALDVADPDDLELVDMDLDGDLDLFSAEHAFQPDLEIWLNDGAGGFAPPLVKTLASQSGLAWSVILDVDEDGLPDAALGGGSTGGQGPRLLIVDGEGANGFGALTYIGSIVRFHDEPRAADMNDDGHLDVVGFESDGGKLMRFLLGDGESLVGPTTLDTGMNGGAQHDLGDVTGDGVTDIVLAYKGDVRLMAGSSAFPLIAVPLDVPVDLRSVLAGDLDGDGDDDLVGLTGQDRLAVARVGAGGVPDLWSLRRLHADAYAYGARWTDMDADGDPDLLVPTTSEGLVLRENLGVIGRWADVGGGTEGAVGPPRLAGAGDLRPGTAVTLALADAAPLSAAWLVIGLSDLYAPFHGGVFVPQLDVVLGGLLTDGAGGLQIDSTWPGVVGGTPSWYQLWVVEGGGLVGSNGLLAVSVD